LSTIEFELNHDQSNLVGMLLEPQGATNGVPLVFCHGIPSGQPPVPGDGGYPELAQIFVDRGHPCALFNFRGTGPSRGSFSLPGWRDDLLALIGHLDGYPNWEQGMVLVGFSGGGASALLAAAQTPAVLGVAAMAAPADFEFLTSQASPELLWQHFVRIGIVDPQLHPDAGQWISSFDEVSVERALEGIGARPLLFVHGDCDATVPAEHARRLFKLAQDPKQLAVLPGGGHRLRCEKQAIDCLHHWIAHNFDARITARGN